jgi:zinc protease
VSNSTNHAMIRHVLPNGLVLLVQRNPIAPTISIRGSIGVGSIHEDAASSGLAVFTGSALVRGTERFSFQQIAERTESVGASLTTAGGVHTTGVFGRGLADDAALLIETLAEVVIRPTFPVDEIERLRAQVLAALREAEHETIVQASRLVRRALFGDAHPYGRLSSGSVTSVAALGSAELAAFHRRYHPAATTIAIVGDIDPPRIIDLAEAAFGAWHTDAAPPECFVPPGMALSGVRHERSVLAGKVQSDVVWAVHGIARHDPEYDAASMADTILGSLGLGGRLGEAIRERDGLAYYCSSHLEADIGAGPWSVVAGVQPDDVPRVLDEINRQVDRFCREGPDADELIDARASMTGSMLRSMQTSDGIAGWLLWIERHQLGADYAQRYPSILAAVSADQIIAVSRRLLSTEHYVVASAGPAGAEGAGERI